MDRSARIVEEHRRTRAWLLGIWSTITMLILLMLAMTLIAAWPPVPLVFLIGIWIVVSIRLAFALRRPCIPPQRHSR